MRVNDKVLIENINDYFTHKGLSPNLIDDIKGKLKKELKKSEAQDLDYIEYRKKSPAEIILTIQRNLFTLQLNPIVFFIINFILLSYLYDKQYVPFQAATGLSIFYCLIILPISIFIYLRIDWKNYLYSNKFERVIGLSVAAAALILVFAHAFGFNLGIVAVSLYAHQFIFFVGIIFSISGVYFKRLEFTGIGLLFCQKTIDAMVSNPVITQIASIVIWVLLLIVIIYYTIRISSRN
ncbi:MULTISPECIES: hypothetical protein [Staphylococcus]|uniref:Uncharacterized protein n=4 Tax=Staphylococcus cohnii TaxID=29382 RepID=A0A2T4LUG0_9STAP|nr:MULTISPECIES: hypothetical protein [Staphylococcus]TGP63459.1 hypothetical protein EN872_05450 [bacterium M00.F.Ca.ET.229.01.1.1]TGS39541.1 hypothetical protein EN823_05445 [bacterium M00.F.Ca.ET.180.01.1.1]AYX89031.1 hypothetical protein EGX68_01855 [Staphylococcus cohnii]KKI64313.1 hypothetical protein UF66_2652 [Staphylococcus cohnii subsp. cohnii]MBA1353350.1 hypothetical protein [Staphylococcus cohnii]